MEPESTVSDTQAAIEAGKQLAIKPIEINGTPMLVCPKDYEITEFNELREHPRRIESHTTHTTLESFISYFNEYADIDSAIFIDNIGNTFAAIIDYHHTECIGWCQNSCEFKLVMTEEWTNWASNNKLKFTQTEFGEFIEENLEEIIEPSGAEMLEIALSIQAKTEVKFSSAQRLDNGQTQITYHEEINGSAGAKGQLKIPEKFTIGLKMFEGGEPYKLEARLRYRINNGSLSMWYELIRKHKAIQANMDDALESLKSAMKLGKIYHGKYQPD